MRNDLISHYALSFNLLVPSETNFLHFTWHAKSKVRAAVRQYARVTQSSEARALPEDGPSSPQKGHWWYRALGLFVSVSDRYSLEPAPLRL